MECVGLGLGIGLGFGVALINPNPNSNPRYTLVHRKGTKGFAPQNTSEQASPNPCPLPPNPDP